MPTLKRCSLLVIPLAAVVIGRFSAQQYRKLNLYWKQLNKGNVLHVVLNSSYCESWDEGQSLNTPLDVSIHATANT